MSRTYFTPPEVAGQGVKAVHQWPQCANEDSVIVGNFDAKKAWATFVKLEINPAHIFTTICLDVDEPSKKGWPGGQPAIQPNWIVVNTRPRSATRRAGGLHLVYSIETPVARHDAARMAPLAYYAHIAERLTYHLGADADYAGVLTRNPLLPGDGVFTHWSRMLPYSLHELDKLLPKGKPPKRHLTGIGRNVDLFRSMTSAVFQPRWTAILEAQGHSGVWLDHVRTLNAATFPESPLPDNECRSIAKSCHKFWMTHYDAKVFSERQTRRNGKRWHDHFNFDFNRQAAEVRELREMGLTQFLIGTIVGMDQSQVSRILSQGS